ncbi:hypothetical protein [Demequina litorisediminis]|nr:hypothetical protein [Demequina litorisediminis]
MRILVLTEDWPGVPASRGAELAAKAWAGVNPAVEVTARALGGGGARTADAWAGERGS